MHLAHTIAVNICQARKCPEMHDDFVGAGLVAYAAYDYDPLLDGDGARPDGAVGQRMQWAMLDLWRKHYLLRNNSGNVRNKCLVSIDQPILGADGSPLFLRDALPASADDFDRVVEIAAARSVVEALREAATPRRREVIDWFLENPVTANRDGSRIAAGEALGVDSSRISQILAELRLLTRSLTAA